MALILAVEPDSRQAQVLTSMVRQRLGAQLVLADTAEAVLASLGDRVPDLILTTALLSTKDETLLAEWLRSVDGAAHVQTLTIPVLETPVPRQPTGRTGIFSLALLAERPSSPAAPDGCDPAVFAEQCASYLERAAKERGGIAADALPEPEPAVAPVPAPAPAPATVVVTRPPAHIEPERIVAAAEPPAPASPEPPPAPAAAAVEESIEIDLSAMLDATVFQQISEAIETASRDSARANAPASGSEAWTPSSLGRAAAWPGMDFAPAPPAHAPVTQSANAAAKRFPARKPLQDEWGFFDPAQCGFSALLAKLDEITHVASSLPEPTPPAGPHDVSH